MMKRKVLSVIIILAMSMSLFPMIALADGPVLCIQYRAADTMEILPNLFPVPDDEFFHGEFVYERPDGTFFPFVAFTTTGDGELYVTDPEFIELAITQEGKYTLQTFPLPEGCEVVEISFENELGKETGSFTITKSETSDVLLGNPFNIVITLKTPAAPPPPSPEPPPPPPPPDPLNGAANWAKEELGLAFDAGLLIEDMFGKWPEDTSRLLAAEAIVRLIEVSTGKTIDAIASEKDFDLSDKFADTDSKAATFLKASGISNGIDGVNYGYSGTFTRAQLVTMLGRMAESVFDMDLSDFPQGSDTFNDIPESMSWAEQYIGWAATLDITQGDGGADKFNPAGNLTNQQTGLFSYRAFDIVFGK